MRERAGFFRRMEGEPADIDTVALLGVWSSHITKPDYLDYTTAVAKDAKLCRDSLLKYKELLIETRAVATQIPPEKAKDDGS